MIIHMVNYYEETKTTFDNVRIITVESGKELNEHELRLKSTHYYYVITDNIKTIILTQEIGLFHSNSNPSST